MYFFENMKIPEAYETTKNYLMMQPCTNNGISGPLKNCNCVIYDTCFFAVKHIKPDGTAGDLLEQETSRLYIADNFRRYKQIYLLNKDLYNNLKTTTGAGTLCAADVLQLLPYPSFYIDMKQTGETLSSSGETVAGAFVCLEHAEHQGGNIDTLRIIIDISGYYVPVSMPVNTKSTITDITDFWPAEHQGRSADDIRSLLSHIIQVILYMCAAGSDVVRVPGTHRKKTGSKAGSNIPKPARVSQIGYKIGPVLSKQKKIYEYSEADSSKEEKHGPSKAPHFRAPHWQLYHVGKGRTETVLKWIDLIFVNGSAGDSDITLHNMR